MLANNNHRIIHRLTMRSIVSNKRRSWIIGLAVLLSTFMLFSILTVGVTFFEMEKLQNIRLNGAEWDAIMYGLTPEQQEKCENNPDIEKTGLIAICGYMEETDADDTIDVGFLYADEIFWNDMMKPARDWVKGTYPQKRNEVMVTEKALEECGLEGLTLGDTFRAVYTDGNDEKHTEEFLISGIWDGYGTQNVFYMSKEFFDQSGYELSSVACARYFMDFHSVLMTEKEQNAFIDSMKLGKQQNVFFNGEFAQAIPIYLGMAGLVVITCFCAYLLIYNILYLSVSGNIRYYGLLRTIGMTGSQIYKFMSQQMLILGSAGIISGLVIGSGVSFLIVPAIIKVMGIWKVKAEVGFHPLILCLTMVVIGVTVFISYRKPAKMAVQISPIEALGYHPSDGRKKSHKTGKGKLLCRMAADQIVKDKKKTTITVISLSVGLCVFLCLTTLIESKGARTMVSNFVNMDLIIKNDTLKKEDQKEWKDILISNLLEDIARNEKIKEVNPMLCAQIIVPWEPDFSDRWMREFYETWMTIPYEDDLQEYKEHPENFGSFLLGINARDFDYLNHTLESPADREKFMEGKTCILYGSGLEFQEDIKGKQVVCADYDNFDNSRSFEIAGMTDESYYMSPLLGDPPIIIISDQVLKEFIPKCYVSKASIRYETEYDEDAEQEVLTQIQNSPDADDFSYESKIEELKYVEKSQGDMMGIGMGITFILAFIGIMNYVNTMIGNIQTRKGELAILESIGMTEKQIVKLVMLEGAVYALGSLLLTGIIGSGITYGIFQSMNYRNIRFYIPLAPAVIMIILTISICVIVPWIAWKRMAKGMSIIEEIKKARF